MSHRGQTLVEGLNVVDGGELGEFNGLHFQIREDAVEVSPRNHCKPLVADVELPDDADVRVSLKGGYAGPCWRADRIIIKNIRPVRHVVSL